MSHSKILNFLNCSTLLQVPHIDLNAVDSEGFTPLFWTVIIDSFSFGNNTMEMAELLLQR